MELYVFSRDLNFRGILESYFSLRWVRRYSKCGEFELHCSLTSETLELLKKENIIWKKGDLEAGYIEYRNLKQDTEGKETLVVKGKFLTGYLGRRIIWGIEKIKTTPELAMRYLIDKHCINPDNPDRIIPYLKLNHLKGIPDDFYYLSANQITWEPVAMNLPEIEKQTSYKNLLEEVESIATTNELGIRTLLDIQNKQMLFDVYQGLDRTAGQTKNAPAIFSKEFENVLEQEYTDSLNNYRNVVLVAGEGEGAARELVIVGQGTGLDRFEMFVDARDLQSTEQVDGEEVSIPIEQYREMLEDRGLSKLSEHKEIQTFDSKINLNSNLVYKEDFDLGDIVTCTSKKWGITIDTRITEVEEVYEESGKQINVVFGNNIPTLIDVIKREVR
jgi:hypothetical protein